MGKPNFNDRFKGKKLSTNALIAEREKKKMYHKYKKMLRKEEKQNMKNSTPGEKVPSRQQKTSYQDEADQKRNTFENDKNFKKMSSYKKVQIEYESKEKEKEEKIQDAEKRKLESNEALKRHKKSRKETFHNLCKKTSRGQIRMGAQIESLLKKIEQTKK